MAMYGKPTGYQDSNGKNVYEFDRIINLKTGKKASVIYRDYPDIPNVAAFALSDDGTFVPLDEFGFYDVLSREQSDQEFCKKYDYRRQE